MICLTVMLENIAIPGRAAALVLVRTNALVVLRRERDDDAKRWKNSMLLILLNRNGGLYYSCFYPRLIDPSTSDLF